MQIVGNARLEGLTTDLHMSMLYLFIETIGFDLTVSSWKSVFDNTDYLFYWLRYF